MGLPTLNFASAPPTLPKFRPDATTMERFDREPMELWAACNSWLERLNDPPDVPPEYDHRFDQLTESLQLWASLHGLGAGMALVDAAILWYRPSARLAGLDTLIRAEAFVQLSKNRAASRMPQEQVRELRATRQLLSGYRPEAAELTG